MPDQTSSPIITQAIRDRALELASGLQSEVATDSAGTQRIIERATAYAAFLATSAPVQAPTVQDTSAPTFDGQAGNNHARKATDITPLSDRDRLEQAIHRAITVTTDATSRALAHVVANAVEAEVQRRIEAEVKDSRQDDLHTLAAVLLAADPASGKVRVTAEILRRLQRAGVNIHTERRSDSEAIFIIVTIDPA
jgi:hypothetical protein